MAIDPRIILGQAGPGQTPAFQNFISNIQSIDQVRDARAVNRQRKAMRPIDLQLAGIGLETSQLDLQNLRRESRGSDQQQRIQSVALGAREILDPLRSNDIEGVRANLTARRQRLLQQGKLTQDTDEALQLLDSNPALLLQRVEQAVNVGQQLGVFGSSNQISVDQRNREAILADLEGGLDETGQLKPVNQLTARQKAAAIKARLIPGATGSAVQTITAAGSAKDIAETEQIISGAKEAGKLGEQLKFKPRIAKALQLAKIEAKAQGEALTDLKTMESALPILKESVAELRELAQIATSTIGGKIFDTAVKQTGFGSTKGATARAKFIAIINNQVLPLLKPTFGAAFTVSEGEALKATMGDPDATPEEKMAQLDAFLEQKERDVRTKTSEVESFTGEAPAAQVINFDAQGNIIQ